MATLNFVGKSTFNINPNTTNVCPKFVLSDLSDTTRDADINLNCFNIPLAVMNRVNGIALEFTDGTTREYPYPLGSEFTDSICPGNSNNTFNLCLCPYDVGPALLFWGLNELKDSGENIQFTLHLLSSSGSALYSFPVVVPSANMQKTIQENPEPEPEEPNNTDFSTIQKAISILGGSMSGRNQKDFIRKSELITLGADSTKLTSYGNNDYVKVGNIVKKTSTSYIFHLPLHSNFKDSVSGTILTTSSSGLTINRFDNNKYLHVKGINAYLNISNLPTGLKVFNKSQWTIEYYMQCLGSDNMINFLSNRDSNEALGYGGTIASGYFAIAVIGRSGWHNYFNYNGKKAYNTSMDYSPITMGDKLMHRITISFNNGTIKMYKDGTQVVVANNPFTKLSSILNTTWKLWIAGAYTSETYIHDITIWDRVLSDSEVASHTEFD